MQIVFHDGTTASELDVVVHDPDALVSDLTRALCPCGAEPGSVLVVDGVVVPGTRRLDRAAIFDGAAVSVRPFDDGPGGDGAFVPGAGSLDHVPPLTDGSGEVITLAVVGGVDAGAAFGVGPGSWTVGRVGCDVALTSPTVSARHATIEVSPDASASVLDHASCNGTWAQGISVRGPAPIGLGAILRLGATQLTVRRSVEDDRTGGGAGRSTPGASTVAFNRPPRTIAEADIDPVEAPQPAPTTPKVGPVGVISILVPLVMAAFMVKVYGNPMFAMFALLSPVMLVGNGLESRRRRHKGRRRDAQQFARQLTEFRRTLDDRACEERHRLEELLPDPAEILRRVLLPSTHLWERRPEHDDTLALRAGIGPVAWDLPLASHRSTLHPDVRRALAEKRLIADAPVVVDLSGGGIVGLVGDRRAALALARSLLIQAAAHHGPADLTMALFAAPEHGREWDWAKWLPHTLDPAGAGHRLLSAEPERSNTLLRSMLDLGGTVARERSVGPAGTMSAPTTLVLFDDESLTEGRRSPGRSVLRGSAGPVAGIVIAATEDRLPAMCSTVVELADEDGSARLHRLQLGQFVEGMLVGGMSEPTARRAARALARYEDPELEVAGSGLPSAIGLLPLIGLDPPDVDSVLERWRDAGQDPDLVTPIGICEDGVLELDMVRDGPHALVAGTTGSGKSELLRSLVAGLAVASPPDHLTFVLVDFKGGSAFDQCARLPHTVGMVTDLDPHLAERALRCLEAELRRRERTLRHHGVSDLAAYRRLPCDVEPLARLMVVVDEFATLKAELGDFVDSLVGVAQRGRSLGVHLVLATQRPSGAVNDNIRANTNLRIALRVQDPTDSKDVIDVPDAAHIGRNQPGRALARLGPGEVIPIQTALATGWAAVAGHGAVESRPFQFGTSVTAGPDLDAAGAQRPTTDLQRLVDALVEAHGRSGRPLPARPWPEPLPPEVDIDGLWLAADPIARFGERGAVIPFALADDPESQTQYPVGWTPADGNLLLIGIGGSGTTTAATSLALSVARSSSPGDVHLYALDFGTGTLVSLAPLAHVGAVVTAGERERQVRLMQWLRTEIDRRRTLPDARRTEPRVVLILDGLSSFRSAWDEAMTPMAADLQRVFGEGPDVGIHSVITADRTGAVPTAIQSLTRQRWLFRLGDPTEFSMIGVRAGSVPNFAPGGALAGGGGEGEVAQQVQVGRPAGGVRAAVQRLADAGSVKVHPARRRPVEIGQLPDEVGRSALAASARTEGTPWVLPLGIGERTLAPAGFTLHEGEHALVAGPSRSGRSRALVTLAEVVRATSAVRVVAVAGARSPLQACTAASEVLEPSALSTDLPRIAADPKPLLLLVDDADLIGDDDGAITTLLAQRRPDVHVVAAGRNDTLRTLYVHWTRTVRLGRTALLLRPDLDLDGDLVGIHLPRRSPVPLTVGRGYLVNGGDVDIVQVALEA